MAELSWATNKVTLFRVSGEGKLGISNNHNQHMKIDTSVAAKRKWQIAWLNNLYNHDCSEISCYATGNEKQKRIQPATSAKRA